MEAGITIDGPSVYSRQYWIIAQGFGTKDVVLCNQQWYKKS